MKKLEEIPEDKRVYIDESGNNTDLDRTHGYALAGEPVEGTTHGVKTEKLNVVAGKCGETIIERHEYSCNMNSRYFEFWFMLVLRVMGEGYWYIMDNATFHRKGVLREMAEAAGSHVVFLPKYSPDLNPIEHEWANLKSFLRSYGRNYDSTSDALLAYFKVA
jgi:transposase